MDETVMTAATQTKKAPSAKQIAANRLNAQKSTGPKTDQGKQAAKFNNLQHGMRAAHIVLPGENRQEFDRRLATWMLDLGAATDAEEFLVERAVRASWKLERGDAAERDLAIAGMKNALKDAALHEADEVDRLAAQLGKDPAGTVRRLRQTKLGCLWMRQQWDNLRLRLEQFWALQISQGTLALNLLGRRVHDVFRDDPLATLWVLAIAGARFGNADDDEEDRADESTVTPSPLSEENRAIIRQIGDDLGGIPEGMARSEYRSRLELLYADLPSSGRGVTCS